MLIRRRVEGERGLLGIVPASRVSASDRLITALTVVPVLLLALPASAQTVSSSSGSTVTITYGQKQGVATGMTGLICAEEEVGDRKVEVCTAKFEIKEVRETSATGTITGGDPGEVAPGHRAVFDQKLISAAPVTSSLPSDAVALLAAGREALHRDDPIRALAAFEKLLQQVPGDTMASKGRDDAQRVIATRQAERERQAREAAARAATEERTRRDQEQLRYLEAALDSARAIGDAAAIASYVDRIRSMSPRHVAISENRHQALSQAAARAREVAKTGDAQTADRVLADATKEWGGDPLLDEASRAVAIALEHFALMRRRKGEEVVTSAEDLLAAGNWRSAAQKAQEALALIADSERARAVAAAAEAHRQLAEQTIAVDRLLFTRRGPLTGTFAQAQMHCDQLEVAGLSNWRTPSGDELKLLLDYDAPHQQCEKWGLERKLFLNPQVSLGTGSRGERICCAWAGDRIGRRSFVLNFDDRVGPLMKLRFSDTWGPCAVLCVAPSRD